MECAVTSTVGARLRAGGNDGAGSDRRDIGWPMGCYGWVVHPEKHDVLLPVGAVGELLIDGPLVASGYLVFIRPPTWAQPQGRHIDHEVEEDRLFDLGTVEKEVQLACGEDDRRDNMGEMQRGNVLLHTLFNYRKVEVLS